MPKNPESVSFDPIVVSIATAVHMSGMSRAELYRRMAAGQIKAIKNGRRTMIDIASLKNYLAALPAALFRSPNAR